MNFPLYIAKRYVRSKSKQSAVNIINMFTFCVIVIGSAALFIVLSGFAGLKTFSLAYTNSFDPDLKALPSIGKFFTITKEQETKLKALEGITSYSKEIEDRVYLTHKKKDHIAYIKGVDANYNTVTGIDSTLYIGTWFNEQQAVAGIGIANLLSLTINNYRSPLEVLVPRAGTGSLSQQGINAKFFNTAPLVISGVYSVEAELDSKYIFASLPFVQALLEKENTQISGINFKYSNTVTLEKVQQNIEKILGGAVILKDRKELNSTLYRMLNTENLATYLIFTLVLIIALFNVVGAFIMMILDQQGNSKTLYSLGTTIKELRRIYFVQGVIVTFLGGFIGVLIGSLLIWSQLAFEWLKITPELAYPVAYQWINIVIVLATITILGIIASKIASSRINKKLLA
ncbi:FtsX-like permease family protein [Cellulophaga baltica]|uniref:ABC transporter permease n=1 Tax=Cellulophaga TaxID=104264 RepID=UPI001C06D70C|nr:MULTISPECIES: FtsX-like permease family protein [Cellulophaga]MBU2995856.1 FtsX-like permease family protein [Cellulophaga baltica]MDO6767251.1 FtsX-like permease family protein [Cellulophaga sp. 1_MG-2023]